MTRKNENGPPQPSPEKTAANLKALRVQIDKLDLHILELLNKRAAVAGQIGKVKADHGGEVFSASREEEVLKNILSANRGPLHPPEQYRRNHRKAGDSCDVGEKAVGRESPLRRTRRSRSRGEEAGD